MSAHQYPFIDVAVHERVRLPFARGEAVVLFSIDMRQVLWSNGRGAALFGHGSIYDFLDAPVPEGDVVFRQLQTAARQLGQSGLGRNLLLRIGTGYRGLPVSAHVQRISLPPGQDAVLFSTPAAGKGEPISERAASLLTGFDDPDTHMAVLDGEGDILAASSGFAALGISEDARRRMVTAARRESDGLVKRPVPTGKGLLPAALGRISVDPALNLLFAVETILGHMDHEQDAATAAEIEAPVPADEAIPSAAAPAGPADGQDEPGHEAEERAAADLPDGEIAASADREPDEGDAGDIGPGDAPAALPAEAEDDSAMAETNASAEAATADPAAASFAPFERASRPVRFVWKIDAEGHFSELSGEFAEVVGPQAADVIGLPFAEVAQRFGFDRDGTIAELLRRRDTWSGKTIHWPVEGTRLRVPVDLAALPTYSRTREFDGFRGFGIVRTADAIEDENALGLAIAGAAETETETGIAAEHDEAEAPPSADPDTFGDETAPAPAPSVLDELLAEEAEGEALVAEDTTAGAETGDDGAPDDVPGNVASGTGTDSHADDDFRGERPALRLVDTSVRRHSEKVVQLDNRRGRVGALTTGEQAAFREIARQLGETFGRRRSGDVPAAPGDGEAAPGDTAPSPTLHEERNDIDGGQMAASASVDVLPEDRDEIPGLEVGEHADDVPAKSVSITGPRTAMDYGLTASVVDALPVALLIHAGDLLIHANPEFLELTGFASLDALEGAGGLAVLLDRPAAEDAAPDGTMLLRHADAKTPMAVNARLQSIRWESGTALMLALSPVASPVPSPADKAVVQARTEAKVGGTLPEDDEEETLEALRDEASELRSILETATDGVVIVDQEGEIRSINRSGSALFNYDEGEIRGKPFAILFAHESQKAVIDYLAGLAGHGVASVLNDGREVIGREASGGFIPLFMTMGRLSSSNGYCAVIRDITQWKRTEEELRNAKRAAETANAHKSDFLARVSHEIRTPLNAIIGFSDMMAGERFGPIGHPRYVEYANDIGRSGRHVLDIVNDLLDISKIEAGEMELDFSAVGLNETVSEAVSLVQPQANGQRVIIRTSLSTSVPPVVADLRSIKQIALNILANAIRFTPSGGQIVVSTSYENNGSVVLRIRDTGVGMTRSELEQAMKPFRQVTTGARKRGDGTGLGLPLTKAMVDANRAHFAISSSPNEGTLVEVTFPSPRVLAV